MCVRERCSTNTHNGYLKSPHFSNNNPTMLFIHLHQFNNIFIAIADFLYISVLCDTYENTTKIYYPQHSAVSPRSAALGNICMGRYNC